jgi:trans-2-enoyl-CoA reductase
LKELAEKYHIPVQLVWNKASKEKWKEERASILEAKDTELSSQVQKATVEIDKGALLDEYRVRSENYQIADNVQTRLIKRWERMTDKELDKLSPADTAKAILACTKAKLESAGLPSQFQVQNNLNIHVKNMESVEQAESKQARFAQMAEMFQKHLQSQKNGVIDV